MKNKIINIFIIVIILVLGIFMYTKYIGTKGLTVKEYRISSEEIPNSFSGVKVVYFSDLLFGSTFDYNDLEKLVNKINELKPEIVIFGGNLLDKNYKINDNATNKITEVLNKIESKLGKYWTKGSFDNDKSTDILNTFTLLDNKTEIIYNEDHEPICISGLGSYVNKEYLLDNIQCDKSYHIVTSHEPDILDNILGIDIDLFLSGNTLGGEINIPKIGYFEKFEGSEKYYKEFYKIDNTLVYISTGLGTRKQYKRLFNRPSINLFRLKSMN